MADDPKEDENRGLTEEELIVAYGGPALSANRCLLSLGSGGVRIAFAERHGENIENFRTAVTLPIQEAIALKDVLTRMLEDIEKQIGVAQVSIAESAPDENG